MNSTVETLAKSSVSGNRLGKKHRESHCPEGKTAMHGMAALHVSLRPLTAVSDDYGF